MDNTWTQKDNELAFIMQVLKSSSCIQEHKQHQAIDWNRLFKLIIRHRVWHQVFDEIKPFADKVPTSFYERLNQFCQKDRLQILKTAAETARISLAFNKHSLFHCFIKGMILNATLYPSLTLRPCKDIDVWVHAEDISIASAALEALGYQQRTPSYPLKGLQKSYYIRHKYDIAFYHPEKKIEVELHFKLAKFGADFPNPTTANTQSIKLFNTSVPTLKDDYNLLYLMLHGARHAYNRLRWLYDIVLYLKSGHCNLQRVRKLAKENNCEHVFDQGLILVQNIFGPTDTAVSALIINPSQHSKKLANTAQCFISANYEFTPEYSAFNKMSFKYRFYLASLAPFRKKIPVVVGDLLKIDKLFPYVCFPDWCFFLYYLLYPFWIMKLFISR